MTTPNLTPIQLEMLEYLHANGAQSAANLGGAIFGRKRGRRGGNCSCPFARPAGAVLACLRKRGLARKVPSKGRTDRHAITSAGVDALQEARR